MGNAPAPAKTYAASIMAGTATGNSALTSTVQITNLWESLVPVGFRFGANVSLDPVVSFYPSSDGGVTFSAVPMAQVSISRLASALQLVHVRLQGGIYAVQLRNSGPSGTFVILTQEQISAIILN